MTGADALLRTAAAAGLDICFANPGTTELDLVKALEGSGVRPILGLFEGVCTGAADAYGRLTDRPALVLLHLGPGLANGLANLHNAAKARTPVVVIVGEHATSHLGKGAPLEADVEGFARPVSCWVRTSRSADALAGDLADAIAAATRPPGGVATLIVPADCAWGDADGLGDMPARVARAHVDDDAIERAAAALPGGVLLLGGDALGSEAGVMAAGRIAAATGCRLMGETFPARMERGGGLPAIERLEYFPEPATDSLRDASALVVAGTAEPIAFFAYPDLPSEISPPDLPVVALSAPGQDGVDALERLAEHLGVADGPLPEPAPPPPTPEPGPLTPTSLGAALAAAQPEGAIIVDEGISSGGPYWAASPGRAAPHAARAHRRRDRAWTTDGDRRRRRLPGPAGARAAGGRQRDVHAAGAVDAGARGARRHDGHHREPRLPDPRDRDAARRHPRARAGHRAAHRPRLAGAGLGRARRRHGRARGPGDDRRGADRRARARARRARAASHRSGAVVRSDELASNADLHERVAASAGGRVLRVRPPRAAGRDDLLNRAAAARRASRYSSSQRSLQKRCSSPSTSATHSRLATTWPQQSHGVITVSQTCVTIGSQWPMRSPLVQP